METNFFFSKLGYSRMYVLKEPPEGNTATRTEITEKKNP